MYSFEPCAGEMLGFIHHPKRHIQGGFIDGEIERETGEALVTLLNWAEKRLGCDPLSLSADDLLRKLAEREHPLIEMTLDEATIASSFRR